MASKKKKMSPKKKSTKKKITQTKKSTKKSSTAKKKVGTSSQKNIKTTIKEPEKIEKTRDLPIVLKTKEVSKNKNDAKQVIDTEEQINKIKEKFRQLEENSEEKIVKPKEKIITKEISKNDNEPTQVLRTEEFTIIKNNNDIKIKKSKNSKKKKKSLSKYSKLKRKIKMYGITSIIPMKYMVLLIIIILGAIFIPMTLKFLSNHNYNLDLEVIPEKIDQLKMVAFDTNNVSNIITSSDSFSKMKDYYEYDFNSVFGLNGSYVEDFVIKYNANDKNMFIAIKPSEGNHDNVKKVFDSFCSSNNIKGYEYLDYDGYLIYIKSKNNKLVLSKVKQSQKRVFNILQELKKSDIKSTLNILEEDYTRALVKVAMLKSDVCSYAIFKPTNEDSANNIKNAMNIYYDGLKIKWANDKENSNLLNNMHFEEYHGYLIYIVSYDNNLAMDFIKS